MSIKTTGEAAFKHTTFFLLDGRRASRIYSLIMLAFLMLASPAAWAGCFLGVPDVSRLNICLNTPNLTDAENFSLATLGEKVWPNDPAAIAVARAWKSAFANDLLGSNGGSQAIGGSTDVATWHITRQANYAGGTPGYVNSAFRADTQVGANVAAYEWSIVGTITNSSVASQAVGVYGQATGMSGAPVWGGVMQSQAKNGGVAVGMEVDAGKDVSGVGQAVGVDVVNTGNMDAAYRAPCGVPALISPTDATSYIWFPCNGGVQIVAHGRVVQSW